MRHDQTMTLRKLLLTGAAGNLGRVLAPDLASLCDELVLSDLPASATRLLGAEVKHAAERRAIEELFGRLPGCAEYLALWEEYAGGGSREARLVKGLDRVEMLAQALAYERAGSRALAEFWSDAEAGWSDEFPILRQLAARLLELRQS